MSGFKRYLHNLKISVTGTRISLLFTVNNWITSTKQSKQSTKQERIKQSSLLYNSSRLSRLFKHVFLIPLQSGALSHHC